MDGKALAQGYLFRLHGTWRALDWLLLLPLVPMAMAVSRGGPWGDEDLFLLWRSGNICHEIKPIETRENSSICVSERLSYP